MKFRKNYESTDDFPGLACKDPSLTLQSEAEACDINYILDRVNHGAQLPPPDGSAKFGDFTQYGDPSTYINSLSLVAEAQEAFSQLPANLRARFQNDPHKLLQFVDDDKNLEEAIKLGLTRSDVKMPEKKSEPEAPTPKP